MKETNGASSKRGSLRSHCAREGAYDFVRACEEAMRAL
jgi:hypothetical protein